MYIVATDRVLCMFAIMVNAWVIARLFDIMLNWPFDRPRFSMNPSASSALFLLIIFNGLTLMALIESAWYCDDVTSNGIGFLIIGVLTLIFQYGIEKLSDGDWRAMLSRGCYLALSNAIIIAITMGEL